MIQLLSDVLGLFLLVAPAWLTARLLRPRPTPLQAASDTLLLSLTLVPIVVFTMCLLSRSWLGPDWMAMVSGLLCCGLTAALVQRHWGDLHRWRDHLFGFERAAGPGTRAAVLAALVVFGLFLVNYDRRHFQYGCINAVVMQALTPEAAPVIDPYEEGDGPKGHSGPEGRDGPGPSDGPDRDGPRRPEGPPTMDLLDVHGTGQRLGTTAIIAPMVSLFDVFGFRLVYALLPTLCVLFGFRLVLRLTGRPRLAVACALLGVLNPYVMKIVILDENVMAFCFTTAALALLVEREHDRGALVLAGVAFGAALGIRHIDLPFALLAAVLIGWRPRALLLFGAVAFVAALPCTLHHQATYGSIFAHEHFIDEVRGTTTHSLLGLFTFEYTGLLNWPFADHLVRTPYNPYPTALYYPLNVLAHLGTALGALAVLGAWRLVRTDRRLTLALAAWLLPQLGLLAVLENWMDPNKMGLIITLFPALVVTLGLGLAWVDRWRRAAVAAATCAALSLLAIAAAHVHVKDDPRFYEKHPPVRPERVEYAEFERSLVTTGNPLPSLYFLQQYAPLRPVERLSMLAQDWTDRRFRRPAPEVQNPDAAAVAVTIDLSTPLIGRAAPIARVERPAGARVMDATASNVQLHIEDLHTWAHPTPAAGLLARHRTFEVDLYLRFGEEGFADVTSDANFTIEERPRPGLQTVRAATSQLTLLLRAGDRLRVLETVSLDEVCVYVWEIEVAEDGGGVDVSVPRKMFHN